MTRGGHPRGRSRNPRGCRGRGTRSHTPHAAAPPPVPMAMQQGPIRGHCEALCPPIEVAERTRTQELSRFERPIDGNKELVPVKRYRRAAAGRDVGDPLELRPAPVLLNTLRHLFTTVLPIGFEVSDSAEFLAVYHFVNDRIRSVRQDFTVQRIEDGSLVTALQQAARFYLLAGLRVVQLLGDEKAQQDWSDKLNDEQLASALAQLQALYQLHELPGFDHEDVPELQQAGEFIAYDLLLHADKPQEVAYRLLKLSPKLRSLPAVQRSLRAFVALQTDDYYKFFNEFGVMTFLERAASLRYLVKLWTQSLRMMNKGFGKQDRFPLEELARWMHLDSEGEGGELAEKLCNVMHIQTQRHPPTPSEQDRAADCWEIVDDLAQHVSSLSVAKSSSVGFAQFKLKPLHDQVDSTALRPLLRAVAFRMEKDLAMTTTGLVMREALEIGTN